MLKHVTDEQRRQPGCSGGGLDQSLDWDWGALTSFL